MNLLVFRRAYCAEKQDWIQFAEQLLHDKTDAVLHLHQFILYVLVTLQTGLLVPVSREKVMEEIVKLNKSMTPAKTANLRYRSVSSAK
jgi:hypothetical protein